MGRSLGKLVLVAALAGFAVLFGMELADDGIKSVYGPVDNGGGSAVVDRQQADDGTSASRSRYYGEEPPGIAYEGDGTAGTGAVRRSGSNGGSLSGTSGARSGRVSGYDDTRSGAAAGADDYGAIPRPDGEPLVDSLADKTASALQALSQGGVRAVVSLFDKLSGS